ncbi:hypothetical protein DMENIID0001_030990 [Sergentomyia squamirostris]
MSCNIIFDKYEAYTAGETITGRVEITMTKSKDIRRISLIIRGRAKVHWTESESYTENGESKTRSVSYSAEEQYLNSETILFGHRDGPTIQLPIGMHSYSFACMLPLGIPGSMDGAHGKIWYDAKVKFDIPWGIDDTFKREFTVIPMVDLNQDQSLRMPSEAEKIKNYCSWSCSSSPAVINVKMPQSGFAVKEEIPITIGINNLSSVEMTEIQTKLVRKIVFTSRSPSSKDKTDESKIIYQKYDIQDPKCQTIDLTSKLTVPHTLLTERNSSIIRTSYHVEIAVYVSGCHNTARLYFPVTIGTYPISPNFQTNNVVPQIAAPITSMMPPVPLPQPSPIPSPIPFRGPMALPVSMPPYPVNNMPSNVPSLPYPPALPTNPENNIDAPPPTYNDVMFGWRGNEKDGHKPSAPSG